MIALCYTMCQGVSPRNLVRPAPKRFSTGGTRPLPRDGLRPTPQPPFPLRGQAETDFSGGLGRLSRTGLRRPPLSAACTRRFRCLCVPTRAALRPLRRAFFNYPKRPTEATRCGGLAGGVRAGRRRPTAGSHRSAEEADHRSMMGDDSTDASRDQSAQARRPSAALDAPTACVRRAVPADRARSSESLRPSRPLRALLRPLPAIG